MIPLGIEGKKCRVNRYSFPVCGQRRIEVLLLGESESQMRSATDTLILEYQIKGVPQTLSLPREVRTSGEYALFTGCEG